MAQRLFVTALFMACIWMAWRLWNAPKERFDGAVIQQTEMRIDTLVMRYAVHDTVQKALRAKAKEMIVHDTVRDTICLAAVDTLYKALDECDSAKALRDTVIVKKDSVVQLVRDSCAKEKPEPDVESIALFAVISSLVTGLLVLFLMR